MLGRRVKMLGENILMILRLLLNSQIIWMIFIKTLKNKIQIRNININNINDMLSNKKFNPTATELFIRGRKLTISLVFITQFYFTVPKNIRLNSMYYFIMKIPNKRELQQINHSSDIDFKSFMNIYKKCTAKPYSF